MLIQNIISAIGLIGIGAILKSLIDFLLKTRELKNQTQHEFKNTRYKVIILLVNAMLDFEKHKPELIKHGRNFSTKEELTDELKTERNNMILFASDLVIQSLNIFIAMPSKNNHYNLAIAIRKDLYGLKTKLKASALKFETQNEK